MSQESLEPKIYSFVVQKSTGESVPLSDYKDRVLLIVNVASRCSFTRQYSGLEDLHTKYSEQGLSILAFPCNQFGNQEPGNDEEIRNFCSLNYNVHFDLFAKVDVNGPTTIPLYQYLKEKAPGLMGLQGVKWNFTKFLVGRDGKVLKRFFAFTTPKQLESEIEQALEQSATA